MDILLPYLLDPWFIILGVVFLAQVLIYLGLFGKLAFFKPDCSLPINQQPVSIIISAKNEAANLKENLPAILEQDYPDYEVIVINDQSEDGTLKVLEELQNHYNHLGIVNIEDYIKKGKGKKFGITLAIKKAQHDVLLFTDADCKPGSHQWINYMQRHYPDRQIVLGFSPMEQGKGIVANFGKYDAFYTALQYFSMAIAGFPYMGVGRNLSYSKALFMDQKGFAKHMHIASGDDDLFVNTYANSENTGFELCKESFLYTSPPQTLREWWQQKQRHLRTGRYYKSGHRTVLGLIWFLQFLLYAGLIIALVFNPYQYGLWALLLLKWTLMGIVYGNALAKFNMFYMLLPAYFWDLLYQLFYYPLMGVVVLVKSKSNDW